MEQTMPLGWLTVFKAVPWGEVLAAAPGIARGARQAWKEVRKGRSGEDPPLVSPQDRLAALETRVQELAAQNLAAAELVESLAEQNARLVQAVEILRLRTRWLAAGVVVLVIVVVALFVRT